jgi:hypothetical protein
LPIIEMSGAVPVASAVVSFWACSLHGTICMLTFTSGLAASKPAIVFFQALMDGVSVLNCQ